MMRCRPAALRRAAVPLALLAFLSACKKTNTYVPPPPQKVSVATPLKQAVTPHLDATGNTVAYNQVDLVARVSGFLQEIRYKDGAAAHRGDTLFVIEPAPYQAKLQQAQAALASAQAQAMQSDAEFDRQQSLGRKDFSSQSSVDQARAQRDANRAAVTNQEAAVTLAATNLGYTQVTAPFDGVVTEHALSVGSMVGVNQPTTLATLVQLDPIYVSFTVSEQDVLRVRAMLRERGLTVAQLGEIPVEIGLMTEDGYPHKGTLDYIAPMVDASTGTLMVRAVFPNAKYALLPGFFVRVRVPLLKEADALLVPDTVLGSDQAGRYVLVVDQNNVVQQRTVKTGLLVGALRVIESGLGSDDRVVISGLQRAVAGEKVVPEPGEIKAAALPTNGKS